MGHASYPLQIHLRKIFREADVDGVSEKGVWLARNALLRE